MEPQTPAAATRPDVVISDALVMQAPAPMDWLIAAPLVIGFIFASVCLMTRKDTARQPALALTGLALMFASNIGLFVHVVNAGPVVMQMGRWLPPFGITFIADSLGATLTLVAGFVGLAVGVYAAREADDTERRYGLYPFLLMMLAGVLAVSPTWLLTGQGSAPGDEDDTQLRLLKSELSRLREDAASLVERLDRTLERLGG